MAAKNNIIAAVTLTNYNTRRNKKNRVLRQINSLWYLKIIRTTTRFTRNLDAPRRNTAGYTRARNRNSWHFLYSCRACINRNFDLLPLSPPMTFYSIFLKSYCILPTAEIKSWLCRVVFDADFCWSARKFLCAVYSTFPSTTVGAKNLWCLFSLHKRMKKKKKTINEKNL